MGPGKSCAVFYSPPAIIQLDSLSFFVVREMLCKDLSNLAVGQMFALKKCEK